MVTYLIPIVATAAGVLLLGESLSWNEPVGAVVILFGAALTQRRPRSGAAVRASGVAGSDAPTAAAREDRAPQAGARETAEAQA
jgi:hypothetical protein